MAAVLSASGLPALQRYGSRTGRPSSEAVRHGLDGKQLFPPRPCLLWATEPWNLRISGHGRSINRFLPIERHAPKRPLLHRYARPGALTCPEEDTVPVRLIGLLVLLLLGITLRAAAPVASFTENRGQWPQQVLFRVLLPNGALFIERDAFTYVLQRGGEAHDHGNPTHDHPAMPFAAHAFKVHFENGRAQRWNGSNQAGHYENFFLGNDPAHWGTGCAVFGEVTLYDVWPGINLHVDGTHGLKYEFIVDPGANPSVVHLRYEGQDDLRLVDERCVVHTSAGNLIEEKPLSYHSDDMDRTPIATHFKLSANELSFQLPANIDHTRGLVIDPVLAFASYSGSTGNNFGFTATYDDAGHLYGGGIVFQPGYPVTTGALDGSFNGPLNPAPLDQTVDIGVSKWSVDGSSLVWSTYIGGVSSEAPHSMVVNAANELYIFGHTGSADFPVTAGCLQPTFAGGPPVNFNTGYGFQQPNGTDMIVVHLNANATVMVASTYIGGSSNDGLNNENTLQNNYGDTFRGEIILDANEHPVVASTTSSTDLPTLNPAQPTYGGGEQDAYCISLNPTLSSAHWATYLGGSGADAAYGVQVDSQGEVFVAGGTTSADLPMHGTPFRSSFAGSAEGYIMRYSALGAPLSSTFLGTSTYDQCYFVQLDTDDAVYVVGQTDGAYPVSPGRYNVPGSSQFIHKLNNELNTSAWSTVFGNGTSGQFLAPTAFLVSNCGQIYFSGWGGAANELAGIFTSTTLGLEVSSSAFQTATDGSDLYLMVLDPEATGLNHATFFGSLTTGEHVDGGTSRFHKNGTIYQAVCAGCQGSDDFPTTPGAWSNTNGALCNLGVFKFDLTAAHAQVSIDGPSTACAPSEVQFINTSTGGDTFAWTFGDGHTSTAFAPAHTYTDPGVYTVSLAMSDSFSCVLPDTTSIVVTILAPPVATIAPQAAICPGASTQLFASDGLSWAWSPSATMNDTTLQTPTVSPTTPTTYTVIVESICGLDTATVYVPWITPSGSAGDDVNVCAGTGVALLATGGGTYLWSPPATLNDATLASPLATPLDTTVYSVIITTPDGCLINDTLVANVHTTPPLPVLADTALCLGDSIELLAPAGTTYAWRPAPGIAHLDTRNPMVTPITPTWYVVTVQNSCGLLVDSALVDVRVLHVLAGPDTTVCPGSMVRFHASPGVEHSWVPTTGLDDPTSATPWCVVDTALTYLVTMADAFGCTATDSLQVNTHPRPTVTAYWEQVLELGRTAQLLAVGQGSFIWRPGVSLSDSTIAAPIAAPDRTTTYTVTLTDANGCTATDMVTLIIPGSLFIPNTFTPNNDGYNDAFGAWGIDIVRIQLDVFDRWGKLIWTTTDLNARWDGRYGGQDAPVDTYVWKVQATEVSGGTYDRTGHVTLVR